MNEYEQYEQECELIRAENRELLDGFVSWLAAAGLSSATIERHKSNIDFYVNEFLLYESTVHASEGVDEVGAFLGHWFIRKALWASGSSIKANATSLKKFYTFMCERGAVSREAVQALKARVKEELSEWVATVERYDDPAVEPKDVWQY